MMRLSWKSLPVPFALALAIAAPALAQSADPAAEARLRKLEAEVTALQRKVFPGGDGTFFPQLQPGQPATPVSGTPATTPVTDMLARMEALESQIARLTAQNEENTNRLGKLEARLATLEAGPAQPAAPGPDAAAATAPPAAAPSQATATSPAPSAAIPVPKPTTSSAPAANSVLAATPAAKPAAPVAKPAAVPTATTAAKPSAERLAAVKAIAKPQTADLGDDEYSYGFRLWEAKFYPEAEQQLKLYLQQYPRHSRASYARNLLGRAYLDEGNLDEAGKWFYENYKADRNGPRAADSVLYLAETWQRKKDDKRVCIALAQFVDDYPADAAGRLRSQYEGLRARVKCN